VLKLTKSIVSERARQVAMVAVADGYIEGVMLLYVKEGYNDGRATFNVTNDLHELSRKIKSAVPAGASWVNRAAVQTIIKFIV